MFQPEHQCGVYNHFTEESSTVFIFTDSGKTGGTVEFGTLNYDKKLIKIINRCEMK